MGLSIPVSVTIFRKREPDPCDETNLPARPPLGAGHPVSASQNPAVCAASFMVAGPPGRERRKARAKPAANLEAWRQRSTPQGRSQASLRAAQTRQASKSITRRRDACIKPHPPHAGIRRKSQNPIPCTGEHMTTTRRPRGRPVTGQAKPAKVRMAAMRQRTFDKLTLTWGD